ncbi:ethanolamine ammonia-lyase reactivating factor EutA [Fertoebacter nigrum]|uniref:Ethanolamine ammonia-lyase reactivating factor EutA n=1 Tax=Fertoeibacter niger TaxID=2656921 RepID=A0A8X8H3W7_9RHOB|nr:ethanolamine ammonia-lyase reactivating factor EutA [Fertoeibacter niger]
MSDAERLAIAQAIWEQETVDMLTVGIDIGSSTTHLLFARVILRREQHELSSRFVVVERRIVWRSPIMLTPFLPDGTIDAHALRHFFHDSYHDAGFAPGDVDSGAVILTGEAIKRTNARLIDEIFAAESGKFVCATAGHKLECILAAHGSGATALSAKRGGVSLHVDIGGGTTKLALLRNGEITSVAAFAVGGRLLAQDAAGEWTRIDDSARLVAQSLGIAAEPAQMADPAQRQRIAARLADLLFDQITGAPLDDLGRALQLTEPLDRSLTPDFITFSGGVSEYVYGYEANDYGDIARPLADALTKRLANLTVPVVDAGQRIRATVIGASQFTVQVSGKTLHLTTPDALPKRNIPVVHLGQPLPEELDPVVLAAAFRQRADVQDCDLSAPLALAFDWSGIPEYPRLRAMAEAILLVAGQSRQHLLAVVIEGDVGQSIGRIIERELGFAGNLVCLDGVQLKDLDFIDIGQLMDPPGVVPVVIKSLLFS